MILGPNAKIPSPETNAEKPSPLLGPQRLTFEAPFLLNQSVTNFNTDILLSPHLSVTWFFAETVWDGGVLLSG